jgi:hypothetical protein
MFGCCEYTLTRMLVGGRSPDQGTLYSPAVFVRVHRSLQGVNASDTQTWTKTFRTLMSLLSNRFVSRALPPFGFSLLSYPAATYGSFRGSNVLTTPVTVPLNCACAVVEAAHTSTQRRKALMAYLQWTR